MMYSGDENLSDDKQNPELVDEVEDDEDDEYDHDFEPDVDEDGEELDECAVCGNDEGDPVHGSGD
jgi:hypothetical protein